MTSLTVQDDDDDFYRKKASFINYNVVIDDFLYKLCDFETQKNYPDPESFKKQLQEAAAKQINELIINREKFKGI